MNKGPVGNLTRDNFASKPFCRFRVLCHIAPLQTVEVIWL